MKSISGRLIIISFVVICVGVAAVLYKIFKSSGDYKGLVLAQMEKEFTEYTAQQQKAERILVGETSSVQYFIDLKKPWKFELHDKLLIVTPSAIEPTPAPELKDEVQKQAQAKISSLLETWAMDKFHTLKDINYKIQF